MTKNISVLGGGKITAALTFALVAAGHNPVLFGADREPLPKPPKQYKPLDLTGYKKPVNGYQKKQRQRKAKRKAK